MPKLFVVILILTLILLGFLFVFLYSNTAPQIPNFNKTTLESAQNFSLKEEKDYFLLSNQNLNLNWKIKKDWKVEKDLANNVILISQDALINQETKILEKGCLVTFRVEYSPLEENFHILANTIKNIKETNQSPSPLLSLYSINDKDVLKEENQNQNLKEIHLYLPFDKGAIVFGLLSSLSESEKCFTQFEDLLKNFEI